MVQTKKNLKNYQQKQSKYKLTALNKSIGVNTYVVYKIALLMLRKQ